MMAAMALAACAEAPTEVAAPSVAAHVLGVAAGGGESNEVEDEEDPGGSLEDPSCDSGHCFAGPVGGECSPAPRGTYVPIGWSVPIPCPAGQYQPDVGAVSCIPAPKGTYVAQTGATEPTPCPAGTTTVAPGATSASMCVPAFTVTGFFAPVEMGGTLNRVKAGSAVPLKFSLGGDFGLNVMAAGFPGSQSITCGANSSIEDIDETVTAGASSLTYDAATGIYTYVWKTERTWSGCRRLTMRFMDGSTIGADFQFTR